ncbi:MAG: response regulator [Nitrospirae bacterium]|nr:response regulator [Nitrospirota bacterium]
MKRVLIVDDNELIRWGLSKQIQEICNVPVEVKSIDNGGDSAHEVSSGFYDICFLDVNLPDANGIDVMQTIKEVSPKTEVIIMSSGDIDSECRKKVEETAYQFISKPFDFYQVKFILNHILDRNGACGALAGIDRRRSERRLFSGSIDYFTVADELEESKVMYMKGMSVDINNGGMGILIDYSLRVGQTIVIDGLFKKTGTVKWISMIRMDTFRAGIEFIQRPKGVSSPLNRN